MNDKFVMPVWSIGSFLVIMNTTMFNVSLPSILHELHLTAALGSWIVSGYSIIFALSTLIFSRLSDFVSIRALLAYGLFIIGGSSIIGFESHSFGMILTARLLQASGAGSVPGLGIVLASRFVPYERRGRAITMISSAVALGFGLGPVIGGAITQFMGWNGLFLVSCMVVPLVPILWKLLPQEPRREFRFDGLGAVMTSLSTVTLLLALTQLSVGFLLFGLFLLAATIWHLKRKSDPFIQLVLVLNPGYRIQLMIAFCAFVLNMSMLFLMPLLLANGFHKEAAEIGMLIFPGALVSSLLTRWVGRLIDQYGNERFLLFGHILVAVSMVFMILFIHLSAYMILIGYLIFAPSFSALTSALSNEVSRLLTKEHIGSGMGLVQLSQFIGGSFAVAACGNLLAWQKNLPLINAFQHIFLLLLLVILGSLLMLIWYFKSKMATLDSNATTSGL